MMLVMTAVVALIWFDTERSAFRGLLCDRPGECVVLRGTDVLGPREDRRFDVAALDTLEKRRTGGKSPHDSLVVLLGTGRDTPYEITGGGETDAVHARIRPFLEDPSLARLEVRSDLEAGDRVFFAAIFLGCFVVTSWLGLEWIRSIIRVRVAVEHARGAVLVERRAPLRRTVSKEVAIAHVLYVEVEKATGAREPRRRVVIVTSEGLDLPLTEGFVRGGAIEHDLFMSDLMTELGLPKEAREPAETRA